MSFKAPLFTNKGKQLYASCLAGSQNIVFTTIKLGDGELTTQAIADLTDLVNPIKTIVLNDKKLIGNDQVLIRAVFKNIDIDTGFYWREVGLYAQDPENPEDREKDILFCYQNAGDLAEYIPSASSQLIDKILSMSLVVSDTDKINVAFFSESYALKEDLDEQIAEQVRALENHKTDTNAHEDKFAQYVKKSGDIMSGNLAKSVNNSSFELYGGSAWANGALLKLNGKESAEKGSFNLTAHNGSEFTELKGTANGSLQWNGAEVLTDKGGNLEGLGFKRSDNSRYTLISGGNAYHLADKSGARIQLYGSECVSGDQGLGSFAITALNATDAISLVGKPNGSLTWGSKNLVRTVNGVNADVEGNVNISSMMPDYNSGIDIKGCFDSNGATWTAPCDGIIIAYTVNEATVFLSHTEANNVADWQKKNWLLYIDTNPNSDAGFGSAIVKKGMTVYSGLGFIITTTCVSGQIIFYPFK